MPPGKFMQIEYAGEKWTLLPQRALFSDRDRALIVADIHFGKPRRFEPQACRCLPGPPRKIWIG